MHRRSLVAAALLLALGGSGAAAPVTVLRAGEISPLGWPYSVFADATVGGDGRTVFIGSSAAVFSRDAGGIRQRVGAGTVLSDGRRVAGVDGPALGAGGCLVVRASFEQGGDAIVERCGATFTVIADGGMPAPGGGFVRAFDPVVFSAGTGVVAFTAALDDGTTAIFRHDGGGTVEIVRSGGPTPTGGTFGTFRLLGVTAAGRVGFGAAVSGGPNGLFAGEGIGVWPIVVSGQGSPAGGTFGTIGAGSINPTDHWAFYATLSTGRSGVFRVDASGVTPSITTLILTDDPIPVPGATLRNFPSSVVPSINPSGAIAFRALLGGEGVAAGAAIFLASPGEDLVVLARTRVATPVGVLTRLRVPVLAADGSAVIQASVSGGGPGLFVSRAGNLAALAPLGEPTDADAGDARFRFTSPSVRDTAEGAVFLGRHDAIFARAADGTVDVIAYAGHRTPVGGIFALFGTPVVDAKGHVFFGADVQGGTFNRALFTGAGDGLTTVVTPHLKTPCGGTVGELFPTAVDTLERPGSAPRGAVFAATLDGTSVAQGLFFFPGKRGRCLARSGRRASGQRVTGFGTPTMGARGQLATLATVGRDSTTRVGVLLRRRGKLKMIALEGSETRSRRGGTFSTLTPPTVARRGALFQASFAESQEGIFIGRSPRRLGLLVATGDLTVDGARIRTLSQPIAVGGEAFFLARVAGGQSAPGLYRVAADRVPKRNDEPLPVAPVLLPGDPGPSDVGGVIMAIGEPRVGPGGVVASVVELAGGSAARAIVRLEPASAAAVP